MTIYPNPFSVSTHITVYGLESKGYLKIYDYLGKEVKQQSVENGENVIDRSHLANGFYFLELWENGGVLAKAKIIIQ